MTVTPELPMAIIPAGNGRVVHAFNGKVIFHLEGKHTNNQLTLWTEFTPPGGGPPLHYHLNEDEWFNVQEGQVSFFTNGQWQEMSPGAVVYLPRRSIHTFKNVGDKPSRMTVATSPSGFELFFTRCAEEFNKPSGPDMARILSISAEHGIHFVT